MTGERTTMTVLGLGPMGTALADALLGRGHRTTVWNRTAAKAAALVSRGAVPADSVADAVAASDLVVSCVADYGVMDEILGDASESLRGRLLVNLSSGTPDEARRAAAWAADHDIGYLDGAIMVPVRTVGRPGAVVLYSGQKSHFDEHRQALESMGDASSHLGEDPGLAVLYNTALLEVMFATVNGFYHGAALAGSAGVPAADFGRLVSEWFLGAVVSPMLSAQAPKIDAHDVAGVDDTMEMNLTAIEHLVRTSEEQGIGASLPRYLAEISRQWLDQGNAGKSYVSMVDFHRGG